MEDLGAHVHVGPWNFGIRIMRQEHPILGWALHPRTSNFREDEEVWSPRAGCVKKGTGVTQPWERGAWDTRS